MATTKKNRVEATPPQARRPHRDELRVRMYRHGLGDCFLLALPTGGERPFYMMIDCGVILGTRDPKPLMRRVVRDIIETTGGRVDLVVATHEHWDHLSGFVQASDLFAGSGSQGEEADGKLRFDALWLAWTEDPRDELANLLRGHRRRTERGLRMALQGLRAAEMDGLGAAGDDGWAVSEQVSSLLGFFGARANSTAGALEALRGLVDRPPRYCRPGEDPIELDGVPGVRFYVLGPPRDERLIKKSRPSRANPEVYEAFGLTPEMAFLAAAGEGPGGLGVPRDSLHPFDASERIPMMQARQLPFFERRYWGDSEEEDAIDQSWRRIDSDWLRAATGLALKLDDDTNNTSLVLAIELVESGRVLLFPGDAQVGNWLGWHELSWTSTDGRKITADDLLARTVLYKVGHHGSHNATLRDQGLELMSHEELVAMVPVNHSMARKKRWPEIPFEPLLERLHERANGRVLRSDDRQPVAKRRCPGGVPPAVWRRFQEQVTETDLYFEFRVGS